MLKLMLCIRNLPSVTIIVLRSFNTIKFIQAAIVETLFIAQRALILQATACTKPSDAILPSILKPLGDGIGEVGNLKDKNRANRDVYNHLCVVAEGIPAVGWVTVVSLYVFIISPFGRSNIFNN